MMFFYPRIINSEGTTYENVEEFTLLGVDFVSDQKLGVKWEKYISKLIKKAYNNIWILKRLVEMGVGRHDLLLAFQTRVRSHVEQNIALWHFAISNKLSSLIEKVQKTCAYIILGKHATPSYSRNLAILGLEQLYERREKLSGHFGRKTLKHPVHSQIFTFSKRSGTRSNQKVPLIPYSRTRRYETSSIPSLSKLLNST